jgi:hypothetical protein
MGTVAATRTARKTQRKPAATNGAMLTTVEAMLANVGPLDPTRAVHAELARKLAATLDRMGPVVAAKMTGQTAGALLRTLDRLGVQRGDGIAATSGRRSQTGAGSTVTAALDPQQASPEEDDLPDDEYWQDLHEASRLEWVFLQNARRRGLPRPGTIAYGQHPWAVDEYEWVAEQRRIREAKPFRPLAILEGRGADPADSVEHKADLADVVTLRRHGWRWPRSWR